MWKFFRWNQNVQKNLSNCVMMWFDGIFRIFWCLCGLVDTCSPERSYYLYLNSITNPNVESVECESYETFEPSCVWPRRPYWRRKFTSANFFRPWTPGMSKNEICIDNTQNCLGLHSVPLQNRIQCKDHKISLNEILWVLEFFKMLSFYQTTRRIIEDFFGQFQTACLSVFYVFWLGLSLPFAMQDQRIAMAFVVKNFSCWGIK